MLATLCAAILTALSNIFETAIDDKRLVRNPMRAKSVRWPKVPEDQREAWPLHTAQRVRDAINARYRISVVLALGCGLRQGEVFGLSPEDVDFARGVIRVRRQVQLLLGRLYFTLPKGGKTRVVDMPPSVASALAEYFMEYPAVEVELPWGGPEPDREKKKVPLILTTTYGDAVRANIFNVEVWKPALGAAGVIPMRKKDERWMASRKEGFHVLRYTYASVILEAGESVVTLARWLGHSSPTITWTTTPTSCPRPAVRDAAPSTPCWASLPRPPRLRRGNGFPRPTRRRGAVILRPSWAFRCPQVDHSA